MMWLFIFFLCLWDLIVENKASIIASIVAFMVLCTGNVLAAGLVWLGIFAIIKTVELKY